MSDAKRQNVQDQGSLKEERPVTKAFELPSYTGKTFLVKDRTVSKDRMCSFKNKTLKRRFSTKL